MVSTAHQTLGRRDLYGQICPGNRAPTSVTRPQDASFRRAFRACCHVAAPPSLSGAILSTGAPRIAHFVENSALPTLIHTFLRIREGAKVAGNNCCSQQGPPVYNGGRIHTPAGRGLSVIAPGKSRAPCVTPRGGYARLSGLLPRRVNRPEQECGRSSRFHRLAHTSRHLIEKSMVSPSTGTPSNPYASPVCTLLIPVARIANLNPGRSHKTGLRSPRLRI